MAWGIGTHLELMRGKSELIQLNCGWAEKKRECMPGKSH